MSDKGTRSQVYSISELEGATGVRRRTIHFYVKEKLLPPPSGRGRTARYSEEHVLRLRLIELMKRSTHLRLEGIREIIEPMTRDELRGEIERLERRGRGIVWAGERGFGFREAGEDAEPEGAGPSPLEEAFMELTDDVSTLSEARFEHPEKRRTRLDFMRRMAKPALETSGGRPAHGEPDVTLTEGADTWTRIRISDDLEIHFRRGGDSRFLERIEQLIAKAKKIFGK